MKQFINQTLSLVLTKLHLPFKKMRLQVNSDFFSHVKGFFMFLENNKEKRVYKNLTFTEDDCWLSDCKILSFLTHTHTEFSPAAASPSCRGANLGKELKHLDRRTCKRTH